MINNAMDAVLAEELARNPAVSLNSLRLKPVLERLQSMGSPRSNGLPSIRDVIETQHHTFGKLGVSLSYTQLKFAKALRLRGLEVAVQTEPEDMRAAYQQYSSIPNDQPPF